MLGNGLLLHSHSFNPTLFLLKDCVTKTTEKTESVLPYKLPKYQCFPFSGKLTEMLNLVNPFKKFPNVL